MMTKYQIVYIKLETTLFNIVRQTDQKKHKRVERAFQKMKQNAVDSRVKLEQRKKLVLTKFENSLTGMTHALNKFYLRS